MTLKQMASAIRNHVVDGVKGAHNEAFSTEQLMHEIILQAETLIIQSIKQGILKRNGLTQRLDGVEIHCADMSGNCEIDSQMSAPHITVPKLSQLFDISESIEYLGPMDNTYNIQVYSNSDYRYHKYNQVTGNKPYAWVNTTSIVPGMYEIYFFNLGKYNNLKFVSISALFENPYEILNTPYADQFSTAEFYAPIMIQSQVIDILTQKYINYYRQLNTPVQPNTQETQ